MKKYIINVLIFSLVISFIILVGLFIPRVTKNQNLYYSLKDKHDRLLNFEGQRIILVGGSNLSFGINSGMIEEELGIPVVNMGLHAGLGLKFMLDDIRNDIRKNDIVILSPEYSLFFDNNWYGTTPMIEMFIINPEVYKNINFKNNKSIIGDLPNIALKNILKYLISSYYSFLGKKKNIGVYERKSFNKYGDVIAHYNLDNEIYDSPKILGDSLNYEAFNYVKIFKEEIENKGALFIYINCSINEKSLINNSQKINFINKHLKKLSITKGELIEIYPDSLFFNSHYHLNKKGVEIRTQNIINKLKDSKYYKFLKIKS